MFWESLFNRYVSVRSISVLNSQTGS